MEKQQEQLKKCRSHVESLLARNGHGGLQVPKLALLAHRPAVAELCRKHRIHLEA